MTDILRCPDCESINIMVLEDQNHWWMQCNHCHAVSDYYDTPEEAIESWQKK